MLNVDDIDKVKQKYWGKTKLQYPWMDYWGMWGQFQSKPLIRVSDRRPLGMIPRMDSIFRKSA